MAFKEFKEKFPERFKSFEEAKKFLAKNKIDKSMLDAIDYMVNHKEYYFLIDFLVKNYSEGGGNKSLFDYIFFQLKDCPKRKEDIILYKKILNSKNKNLRLSFLEYLKTCAEELFPILYKYIKQEDFKDIALCLLLYIDSGKLKELIKAKKIDKETIKELANNIYLYGNKKDLPILNYIKEVFPECSEKIQEIITIIENQNKILPK